MTGRQGKPGALGVVVVCGAPYEVLPLDPGDIASGLLVRQRGGVRAYKVVCLDDGDVVLRNLRHPHLFQVEPLKEMVSGYRRIEPAESGLEKRA